MFVVRFGIGYGPPTTRDDVEVGIMVKIGDKWGGGSRGDVGIDCVVVALSRRMRELAPKHEGGYVGKGNLTSKS